MVAPVRATLTGAGGFGLGFPQSLRRRPTDAGNSQFTGDPHDLGRMQRAATGRRFFKLRLAGEAVGDDDGRRIGIAGRGKQANLSALHRDVVLAVLKSQEPASPQQAPFASVASMPMRSFRSFNSGSIPPVALW